MSGEYSDFDSQRIKHLELLQAVISRLANEAALIRGWALTVSAAFFGFAAHSVSWQVAAIGLLPALAFWGLNAYYLRAERQFRSLYDRVRYHDPDVQPFSMNARGEKVDSTSQVGWSVTLRMFYGSIILVGLILIVVDWLT